MIKQRKHIFTIPPDIKSEVTRQMKYLQTEHGQPPVISSACHQISLEEYKEQMQHTTRESLDGLMNFVIDNVSMSLMEKEEKVAMFQKHHPEVFLLQFPDGKF